MIFQQQSAVDKRRAQAISYLVIVIMLVIASPSTYGANKDRVTIERITPAYPSKQKISQQQAVAIAKTWLTTGLDKTAIISTDVLVTDVNNDGFTFDANTSDGFAGGSSIDRVTTLPGRVIMRETETRVKVKRVSYKIRFNEVTEIKLITIQEAQVNNQSIKKYSLQLFCKNESGIYINACGANPRDVEIQVKSSYSTSLPKQNLNEIISALLLLCNNIKTSPQKSETFERKSP